MEKAFPKNDRTSGKSWATPLGRRRTQSPCNSPAGHSQDVWVPVRVHKLPEDGEGRTSARSWAPSPHTHTQLRGMRSRHALGARNRGARSGHSLWERSPATAQAVKAWTTKKKINTTGASRCGEARGLGSGGFRPTTTNLVCRMFALSGQCLPLARAPSFVCIPRAPHGARCCCLLIACTKIGARFERIPAPITSCCVAVLLHHPSCPGQLGFGASSERAPSVGVRTRSAYPERMPRVCAVCPECMSELLQVHSNEGGGVHAPCPSARRLFGPECAIDPRIYDRHA